MELRGRHLRLKNYIIEVEEQLKSTKSDEALLSEILNLKSHLSRAVSLIREAELKEEAIASGKNVEIDNLRRQVFSLKQRNSLLASRLNKQDMNTNIIDDEGSTPKDLPVLLQPINITVTVTPNDRKNHLLLQHIQSIVTTSEATGLFIQSPELLVADFKARMADMEADHTLQTKLAAKWEKATTQYAAKIKELKAQPLCSVSKHRNMADELEAKQWQFMTQEQLRADWQRKEDGVREGWKWGV
jgi:hypothetical protein